jgi:hypothetical protein
VNSSPGGPFAPTLIDPLNRVETVLARFTTVGLDECRKQNVIDEAWPRASDLGGFAVGAPGDITATSQSDCGEHQPPKHEYKGQAQPEVANTHVHSPSQQI